MTPEPLRIRRMEAEDVPRVMDIERRVFAMAWTPDMLYKETSTGQDSLPLVALAGDRLVAYAVLWFVGPRLHLANVAVDPEFRRRGIGTMLLGSVLEEARSRGFRRVSLETRVSNRAAIALFRKSRFRTVTISHGYYTDNDEDALIMVRTLESGSERDSKRTGRPLSGGPRNSPSGRSPDSSSSEDWVGR